MEDRWVIDADTDLQSKITALSLKFGVLCRFTAFVALDRSAVVNQGGQNLELVQPVETPDGWESRQPVTRRRGTIFLASQHPGAMRNFSSVPMQPPSPANDDTDLCSVAGETQEYVDSFLEDGSEETEDSAEYCNGGPLNGSHSPELDLAAYRQRAREMLERIAGG